MKRILLVIAVLVLVTMPVRGELINFNFDGGTPTLNTGQPTPFDHTVGGVMAQFSSPEETGSSRAFSVQGQNTTFYNLSTFTGKYLSDARANRDTLQISFSSLLDSFTFDFATMDLQDNREVPSNIVLNAYWDSTNNFVGSATTHGTYTDDTFPQGTLSFNSGGPLFNLVQISVPWDPVVTTADFLVDDIQVNTVPVPEPTSFFSFGIGLLSATSLVRRRMR